MKRSSVGLAALLVTIAMALTAAPVAGAASGNPIFKQCQSGGALTGYTVAQLEHALKTLPTTIKEYTSCQDVIQQAINQAKGHRTGTGTGSGSGGSFLPTPVIIVLVILLLAAVVFAALSIRRRSGGPGAGPGGDPDVGPGGTRVMPKPGSGPSGGGSSEARTRVMPSPDEPDSRGEDPS